MDIPLCVPDIGSEEIEAVTEVLKSGWLAHGPKTKCFEENFAAYIGTKHAVSFNSCTSALQIALLAHGIRGEVILPSFTFAASANAVLAAGAKPIFVDIDKETCNVSPDRIREAVTADTQALMPVHFAGQSCRIDEIMEIAGKHDLTVIEDSAETLGGLFKGRKTGSFGTGCFSFYPTKNITTGEGGMLTTDDDHVAQKARTLHAHGIATSAHDREGGKKPWLREASLPGYNYRLCDILATIGIVQLKKLDTMNRRRREHAAFLTKHLKGMVGIIPPIEEKDCTHVYQMYTVRLDKNLDRTSFVAALRRKGVGASVHFDPPVHMQPLYSVHNHNPLPVTEEVAQTIVTLPLYPQLAKKELDHVVSSVEEALKQAR